MLGFEGNKRRREGQWLRELYDEESGLEREQGAVGGRGFSVHRSYPIIKSNTGKPTYLQLKWAIDLIRLWANGVATKRVPQYPSEAAATKQKGEFSGEQAKSVPTGKPKARKARKAVDRLPQVQTWNGDAPVRRKKWRRSPRVRT